MIPLIIKDIPWSYKEVIKIEVLPHGWKLLTETNTNYVIFHSVTHLL